MTPADRLRAAVANGLALLAPTAPPDRLRVALAFSGGLDSSVLLHLLAGHPAIELVALHVHHGLSPNADDWLAFCAATCATLGVTFDHARVDLRDRATASLEAAARTARYDALADLCRRHDRTVLCTAHHAGDQAETVLLNLLRGSGIAGLAGMRPARQRGPLTLLRPLLSIDPADLKAYAQSTGIEHIEDESNRDTRYTRNAVRHQLMPVLHAIEPTVLERLARTAAHAAEAQSLLDEMAAADLAACMASQGPDAAAHAAANSRSAGPGAEPGAEPGPGAEPNKITTPALPLALARFNALPPARAANALRAWLRQHGLRVPTTPVLREMRNQLAGASGATALRIGHDGRELRAWRGVLQVVPRAAAPGEPVTFDWNGASTHDFPQWRGRLAVYPTPTWGVPAALLRAGPLRLVPRSGGERLKRGPDRPSRSLKNLYQEVGIAPWRRAQLPLLYAGDTLLYAAGLGMDARCLTDAATTAEPLFIFEWFPTETLP